MFVIVGHWLHRLSLYSPILSGWFRTLRTVLWKSHTSYVILVCQHLRPSSNFLFTLLLYSCYRKEEALLISTHQVKQVLTRKLQHV